MWQALRKCISLAVDATHGKSIHCVAFFLIYHMGIAVEGE